MAGLDRGAISRAAPAGTDLAVVGIGLAIGSIGEAIIIARGMLRVRHKGASAGLRVVHMGWVAECAVGWVIIDSRSCPSLRLVHSFPFLCSF